jgi:hypothetical protein
MTNDAVPTLQENMRRMREQLDALDTIRADIDRSVVRLLTPPIFEMVGGKHGNLDRPKA